MAPNYYQILNVPSNASVIEIKKAFRELALQKHSDKGGDDEAFKLLNEAHVMLKDKEIRKLYDDLFFKNRRAWIPFNTTPFQPTPFNPNMVALSWWTKTFNSSTTLEEKLKRKLEKAENAHAKQQQLAKEKHEKVQEKAKKDHEKSFADYWKTLDYLNWSKALENYKIQKKKEELKAECDIPFEFCDSNTQLLSQATLPERLGKIIREFSCHRSNILDKINYKSDLYALTIDMETYKDRVDALKRNFQEEQALLNQFKDIKNHLNIDIKNLKHLEYWHQQTYHGLGFGGIGIKHASGKIFRVPTRIHAMMQLAARTDFLDKNDFIDQLNSARKKRPSYWNNPFSFLTRKIVTKEVYYAENIENITLTL